MIVKNKSLFFILRPIPRVKKQPEPKTEKSFRCKQITYYFIYELSEFMAQLCHLFFYQVSVVHVVSHVVSFFVFFAIWRTHNSWLCRTKVFFSFFVLFPEWKTTCAENRKILEMQTENPILNFQKSFKTYFLCVHTLYSGKYQKLWYGTLVHTCSKSMNSNKYSSFMFFFSKMSKITQVVCLSFRHEEKNEKWNVSYG